MDFVTKINNCPLTLQQLRIAIESVNALPEHDRHFEGRTITWVHMLKDGTIPSNGHDIGDVLKSIDFRLEALDRLRVSPLFKAWSSKAKEPDAILIHDEVLAAAGTEPLQLDETGKKLCFDEGQFFQRVLRMVEPDGQRA
jgi:hypothetical protein